MWVKVNGSTHAQRKGRGEQDNVTVCSVIKLQIITLLTQPLIVQCFFVFSRNAYQNGWGPDSKLHIISSLFLFHSFEMSIKWSSQCSFRRIQSTLNTVEFKGEIMFVSLEMAKSNSPLVSDSSRNSGEKRLRSRRTIIICIPSLQVDTWEQCIFICHLSKQFPKIHFHAIALSPSFNLFMQFLFLNGYWTNEQNANIINIIYKWRQPNAHSFSVSLSLSSRAHKYINIVI